jgi:hypothetical protein
VRPFGRESIVNLVHKMIVRSLVRAVETGLQLKLLIVCRPFEFFSPLTKLCSCIFVHEESWESEEDQSEHSFYVPAYARYERTLNVMVCGNFKDCLEYCEVHDPVQLNASVADIGTNESLSGWLLLDFTGESIHAPSCDCRSIIAVDMSLVNIDGCFESTDNDTNKTTDDIFGSDYTQCSQEDKDTEVYGMIISRTYNSGAHDKMVNINMSGGDLEVMCEAMGQSLKGITVAANKSIAPYIGFQTTTGLYGAL